MKECKLCAQTTGEQIREDIVLKSITMQSPEVFSGTIEECPRRKTYLADQIRKNEEPITGGDVPKPYR